MSVCKIVYYQFENEQARRMVADLLEELRPLLPKWLDSLSVVSDTRAPGPNTPAQCIATNPEYLWGRISIFGRFFDMDPEDQLNAVIHEIVHLINAEQWQYITRALVDPIQERNPELHSHVAEELRKHNERFTETFSRALARQILAERKRSI